MSKFFAPHSYTLDNQLRDNMRYGDVRTEDNDTIYKDHGDYVEMIIPADNSKGHCTYNVYPDGHWEPHNNN